MEVWFPQAPETHGISKTCVYHAYKTLQHLMKGTPWALQMMDASSKFPVGLMKGNILNVGNYDECLQVEVKEDWGSFIGQHCMATIGIPTNIFSTGYISNLKMPPVIPLMHSICVPSTCTSADLQYVVSRVGNYTIIDPMLCHTRESSPLLPKEWMAIGILSFIGILCLLSTIYDLLVPATEKGKINQFIRVFSWYNNWKGLFSTEIGPDTIQILNGLRFWSIYFIVGGHVAVLGKIQPAINYVDYMDKIRRWNSLFITNAPFAVDTFFVISGLVLSYNFIKTTDTYKHFNLAVFYGHRLIRVFPMLAVIVMINSTILHRFGNGPLWDVIVSVTEGKYCADYWWSTLLFIQNYVNTQCNCVLTSWFLAVDMQLYWISPVLLLTLYKRPRLGLILAASATIIGMMISFVEAYINKDTPNNSRPTTKFDNRYYYTHTRYVTWVMGVAAGYLFYKIRGWLKEIKAGTVNVSKIVVTAGWLMFAVLFSSILYVLYPFEQLDYDYNPVEGGLYFALTRPLWALCILWLIFACEAGCGGILNSFLSWHGFFPLGRLTFSIYLIHFDVILAYMFSAKLPVNNSNFEKLTESTNILIITVLLSIVLSLSIETPFISLLRILQRIIKQQYEHKAASLAAISIEAGKKQEPLTSNLKICSR